MIYFENHQAAIRWDDTDKIVSVEWRGYADGEDYRRILLTLAELVEEKSARRLLVDSRKAKVVTPADQEWVNTTWTARMNKAGLRFTALLVPDSMVAKMSLDRMRSKYLHTLPNGGGSQYFTDPEDARKWLRLTPG